MIVQFKGKVAKETKYSRDNEDSYRWSERKGRAVVSDGASESFAAQIWSNLIAEHFHRSRSVNQSSIARIINAYNQKVRYKDLSWAKQAAYSRGSFASLLALSENRVKRSVEILAIGDSLAVLCNESQILCSFPYTKSKEFKQHPELLCTNPEHNKFTTSPDFDEKHRVSWLVDDKTRILLMTDALGEWCLRNVEENNPDWLKLLSIRRLIELRELVLRERRLGKMRIDDTSLIILNF